MTKKRTRRKFTKEFKQEAVRLCKRKPVQEAAAALGLAPELLHRWRRDFERDGSDAFRGNGNRTAVEEENGQLRQAPEVRYAFILEHKAQYRIRILCRAMNVTVQAYYASLRRGKSQRKREDEKPGDLIEVIFYENKRRYGVKRIGDELRDRGKKHGKTRVSRLMKERSLEAKGKKKFRVTTDSEHSHPVADNVLDRNFSPEAPDQVWAGDITYIWTREGWVYLAVFLDLYSRKVVGWALSKRLTASFVLLAFERALARRNPEENLLVHTDRGSQYASKVFQQMLATEKHKLSMSRKGNCWDNAVVESFFARFKVEAVHGETFQTRRELEFEVFDYIERFYNTRRKHSTLEYLSPQLYEQKYRETRAA